MNYYIGEIRLVGFEVVPKGWAVCDGALLSISQNKALFALLGTTYGGNGATNFGLPDLRGRTPLGVSTDREFSIGMMGGQEQVMLNFTQLPSHTHATITGTIATAADATETSPFNKYPSTNEAGSAEYTAGASTGTLAVDALQLTIQGGGGGQPHENRQPYQAVNHIIALTGDFPPSG